MTVSIISVGMGGAVGAIVLLLAAFTASKAGSITRRARVAGAARGWSTPAHTGAVSITRSQSRLLDDLANRLLPRPALLRSRLEATGLPISIGNYAAACSTVLIVVTGLLLAVGLGLAASAFLAVAAAVFLPHTVVGRLGRRRSDRFLKILPDAIGLIVRGLRAGLPVTETIAAVGREISDPVGEEFREVADQVRLGRAIEEAMWAMAKRMNLPELNFLVISLSVQRETGGNLAETLENLNQILRSRGQMRLKIKAMSSEATASALIIGSLPFVMGILMMVFNPEYLSVLFTNPLGQMMFAGGLMSLLTGASIMRKMVRFQI